MPAQQVPDEKPSYLSFTTLVNFLDRLGAGPIPPRIDKSALDTYSGGVQAILLASLRSMEFVDDQGRVLDPLREAATDEDARKAHLTRYARRAYAKQLALAEQNATAQMLHESFAEVGYQGSTLRKAVVFYLSLVDYLGLPSSPHFRPPRQPAAGTTSRRLRRAASPAPSSGPSPAPAAPFGASTSPQAETRTFRVRGGATVTLVVEARWLDLPIETITKLRQVISDLEDLGEKALPEAGSDGGITE